MKKRVIILFSIVLAFVGLVLAMPEVSRMKPSRLAKNLPESFGDWMGTPSEPGLREKEILAGDTEFERMQYVHQGFEQLPAIEASIVFSGKNLSQSIHRPEVCLRAQGWEFVKESYFTWEDVLPDGEALPVKEIICRRVYQYENDEGDLVPHLLKNGEVAYIWRVFYYTFFGHTQIVSGHYQRTGADIKDRLFKGYDQRWAYATFSSFITKRHADQGMNPPGAMAFDDEETKTHIADFLRELLPQVVAAPGMGKDSSLTEENH